MRALDNIEAVQEIARLNHKPVLYISGSDWCWHIKSRNDGPPSVPFLNMREHAQILHEGRAIIICEDEAEQEALYQSCVGDDGPTKLNPYNGPDRTYALTVSADGELLNENT